MPRTVEFGDRELVLRLTGLVHYESLTEELRIPYRCIASVTTEPFVPPPGSIKMFGTHVPFTDLREGRYSYQGEWYFLSVEDRRRAVTLWLEGYSHGDGSEPLRAVVIGTDDPASLRAAIDKIRGARPPSDRPPA
jgi:hypothetical protein